MNSVSASFTQWRSRVSDLATIFTTGSQRERVARIPETAYSPQWHDWREAPRVDPAAGLMTAEVLQIATDIITFEDAVAP